ncbi:hypothetical protein ABG768_003885 [Culter alburnus]|uniref:Uncharacterized protein n=1 Tax=Culter alburnus TaxID=194366 RepID=A0AAW2A159_CULAL
MANVKKAIGLKFPLYCLGFGHDVNFDFLTKMSLENGGVARRIYEDSDADLQLQVDYRESGFYDEVAVPLLADIQLKYTGGTNLTKTSFNLRMKWKLPTNPKREERIPDLQVKTELF